MSHAVKIKIVFAASSVSMVVAFPLPNVSITPIVLGALLVKSVYVALIQSVSKISIALPMRFALQTRAFLSSSVRVPMTVQKGLPV